MALVCRLCRAKASSTHYCSLVSSLAVQRKLSSRLESLLEVEVDTKDGLPHIICNKCKRHFETLERASEDLTRFRKQARDSFVALSARGITKRSKECSTEIGVSPDIVKARPPLKRLTGRRLDFNG